MHYKKITQLSLLLLTIFTLAACSSGDDAKAENENENELTYAMTKDIGDMNPHLYTGYMAAQGVVFETLVENTEEGIKPSLAESWDISENGKVYTFTLRDDVKFHDGEPFNAEAVKKNIDAVQENAEVHSWIQLSQKITETKVIDEYTVEINLSEAYYPTLSELSTTRPYTFLSPNDFKDGGTKNGVNGYNGTGPYILTEHKKEEAAVFEANEQYWNGVPDVKKVTSKVLPSGETTFLALKKGEINFLFTDDRGANSIDYESMEALEASGEYQVVRSKPMDTKLIAVNSSNEDSPIRETAVREAIWYAIDRKTISESILNGTEQPAGTLLSKNIPYADVDLKERGYDPEMAMELLDKAGWKLDEGSGVRTKEGNDLNVTFYYDSNAPAQKTQAEFIQDSLKNMGINLEIIGEDSTSIADRRKSGNYELLYTRTWGLAYDPESTISAFTDVSYNLHSTKGMKNSDELYKKIDEVMVTVDKEERQSLYDDILTMVHDEAVFIPITYGGMTVVAPENLENINFKQTQYELPFEEMAYREK
ncbi:staphylopine-dependent metal ABC transporter substrate-binding lipoprotein [Halobacillus kuroshimensis]|uniref:staphylopine-dependent metal ABC transporter substrate-binding lipoprotein n=1 Tax=Halobacillus kuroshimensis TaxID=302481 RepID=UPI00041B7054|nr:nickel ABC transporter substrate-binding protein [Halobacillus kuroshimensis]